MDCAFRYMKAPVEQDCLLVYPSHNKPFHIYIIASSYQIGAYIIQDNKPVFFWLCELSDDQMKYTVGDKEVLSIVMILTDSCTMLLGAVLHIHTDHLNITTNNTTTDHTICKLNYVEHFNLYIHFIPGRDNVIANMLSWLDCLEEYLLTKDKQVLFSKIWFQMEWTLPLFYFSLNISYIYHPFHCVIQIQLTINGYLPNRTKLTNLSDNNKNFQTDISTKYLMTKKLFIMPPLVTIMAHNGNFPFSNSTTPHACYAAIQVSPPASLPLPAH